MRLRNRRYTRTSHTSSLVLPAFVWNVFTTLLLDTLGVLVDKARGLSAVSGKSTLPVWMRHPKRASSVQLARVSTRLKDSGTKARASIKVTDVACVSSHHLWSRCACGAPPSINLLFVQAESDW